MRAWATAGSQRSVETCFMPIWPDWMTSFFESR